MRKTWTMVGAVVAASAAAVSYAQPVQGNAEAGQGKIAMCIGCHGIAGYQSSFPQVHRVPMISGQNAAYIASALLAYQKGERKHPTMRGIADPLSEQDIADISAYYAGHGKSAQSRPTREPSAQVSGLIQKGACFSCHGDGFAKPIDPSYPKVAGQYPDYLYVALASYKADKNMAVVGRSNGVMGGIVGQFTLAELKALSQYIGTLPGELQTVPQSRFR